jgi:hypothetical protein
VVAVSLKNRRVRERDLEGHFTHEEADPEEGEDAGAADSDPGADIQLTRAVEVLKSWTYFERLRREDAPTSLQARASSDTRSEAR